MFCTTSLEPKLKVCDVFFPELAPCNWKKQMEFETSKWRIQEHAGRLSTRWNIKTKGKVLQSRLPVTLAKYAILVYTCCTRSQPRSGTLPTGSRMHQVPSLPSVVHHGQRQLNSSACFTPRRVSQAKIDDSFRSRKTKIATDRSLIELPN